MFHEQCKTVQNALVKKEARRMNPKCQKKKKKKKKKARRRCMNPKCKPNDSNK